MAIRKTDVKKIISKSVTAKDTNEVRNGQVINMIVPFLPAQTLGNLPPELPAYWSPHRDALLRATVVKEAFWGSAISIAITKIASLGWEIQSEYPRLRNRYHELLLEADTIRVGWVSFLSKVLRDYLTTDNGAFIEIVRATKSAGSAIIGLRHLDSLRCTRTGDPEKPVLYRDRIGQIHELRDYQIISMSDMPDPSDTWYGVGVCAASRAYASVYKLSTIEWYLREKIGGLHPLAIYIVNGVLDKQLKDAVQTVEQEKTARGLVSYMGAVIVGVPDDAAPQVAVIPLAELPDRFNRKEEFDIALLNYADAIGLDIQDLQPLSGQPIGTGTQSQTLADKAKGKGLASFRMDFIHALNTYVLPETCQFVFIEKDYRDLTQAASISQMLAGVSKLRIEAGITTAEQERKILVAKDELPKELLEEAAPKPPEEEQSEPTDEEGEDFGDISDSEKPKTERATLQGVSDEENEDTEKALRSELANALAIYEKSLEDADDMKFKDFAELLKDVIVKGNGGNGSGAQTMVSIPSVQIVMPNEAIQNALKEMVQPPSVTNVINVPEQPAPTIRNEIVVPPAPAPVVMNEVKIPPLEAPAVNNVINVEPPPPAEGQRSRTPARTA